MIAPAPRGDKHGVPVMCEGCGFTLGWVVRLKTDLILVRSPRVPLTLHSDHRWLMACPECGVRWQGIDSRYGPKIQVA